MTRDDVRALPLRLVHHTLIRIRGIIYCGAFISDACGGVQTIASTLFDAMITLAGSEAGRDVDTYVNLAEHLARQIEFYGRKGIEGKEATVDVAKLDEAIALLEDALAGVHELDAALPEIAATLGVVFKSTAVLQPPRGVLLDLPENRVPVLTRTKGPRLRAHVGRED